MGRRGVLCRRTRVESLCCGLVAVVLLSGCPTQYNSPAGCSAADPGGARTNFSPRGSFIGSGKDGKPHRVRSELVGVQMGAEELTGGDKWAAKQSAARDDEFHLRPGRSYSEQLMAMMKNMSLPETPSTRIANHTSVQELANTLLADPMSLFRRRTRIRSSAPAAAAQTGGENKSTDAACVSSTTATNGTASASEGGPENSETNSHKGIPQLTLPQREALVRKWGAAFEQLEEEAFALFCRLHSGEFQSR